MNRFAVLGAVGLLVSGIFFSGCSDDEPNPEPGIEAGTGATPSGKGGSGNSGNSGGKANSGGSGNKAGTGNAGGDETGGSGGGGNTDASTGGTGNPDDGGGTGGTSTGGSTGMTDSGPACVQDPKKTCGTCPPTSTDEFLNHCTDSKCTKFDNTKLEKFVNGMLPDLP